MKANQTVPTPDANTPPEMDSRAEIVHAAADCFMSKGFEKTTIDDIADALGATKGRVYHHFRSKSAIFFAVYRQAMAYCFDAVEPVCALPLPAAERLGQMAEAHAMVMMTRLSFQRGIRQAVEIYMRGATTEGERADFKDLLDLRDRYERLFRDVLADGNRDGTLQVADVPLAGRAILGALNGLTDWYRPSDQGQPPEVLARKLADLVLHGVAGIRSASRGAGLPDGSEPEHGGYGALA